MSEIKPETNEVVESNGIRSKENRAKERAQGACVMTRKTLCHDSTRDL